MSKFELNFLPTDAKDEDIFEEIKRVDAIVGKDVLTKKDFEKHSKIHPSTLMRRFGDWGKVLELAGLSHKYCGRVITEKQRTQEAKGMSNAAILAELKRIAEKLGKETITVKDVKTHSRILDPAIVKRRFGTWTEGMCKAGLKLSEMYHRAYSDEEYFENLLNVWTHYGRQPVWREMQGNPSEIGPDGYRNRFGGWRKALEAFVNRMKQDVNAEVAFKKDNIEPEVRQEIKRHSISVENKRGIPLGLRYKVLTAGSFRCCRCGKSPSTTIGLELEIDHKIPFSKGGKTIFENLQVLCKDCNNGKGNRFFE